MHCFFFTVARKLFIWFTVVRNPSPISFYHLSMFYCIWGPYVRLINSPVSRKEDPLLCNTLPSLLINHLLGRCLLNVLISILLDTPSPPLLYHHQVNRALYQCSPVWQLHLNHTQQSLQSSVSHQQWTADKEYSSPHHPSRLNVSVCPPNPFLEPLYTMAKDYDYLLKVLLVGDSDVGKHEIMSGLEDCSSESPFCSGSGE